MNTSTTDANKALEILRSNREEWARLNVRQRVKLVDDIIRKMKVVSDHWVHSELMARSIDPESDEASEAWVGISFIFRLLHTLRKSLYEISKNKRPIIPGPIKTRENRQVVAPVVPRTLVERLLKNQLLYRGITAEVWMEPGVTGEEVIGSQALK